MGELGQHGDTWRFRRTRRPDLPSLPLTPQQAAGQALAKVGPTTAVSVDGNVTVAGEAAYQLVLAPKSAGSLIGQVRIAIDARHNVPLRVQVFAKSAASPAIEVGFTSVSFGRPAAGTSRSARPLGRRSSRRAPGPGEGRRPCARSPANGVRVIGNGWLAVADLPESRCRR